MGKETRKNKRYQNSSNQIKTYLQDNHGSEAMQLKACVLWELYPIVLTRPTQSKSSRKKTIVKGNNRKRNQS